ncbi:DJ-1/PfpI family protein [Agrobacterium tumefaciens]|uniref:Thiamine biosynthesis protein ThiJ n=1 Tax=Agrobacterium tumefaciens TaxID=358 RepID=A0A176XHE6_AGRTU|nr:DJ-1/PfpI family protein [Agrobacterium tumefaciens]OAE48241.1 thiamine biosynthesis protein ThiJ [Agrobacterium tumefaciens]
MVSNAIGFLLFPQLTQLDLTGPFEVFARAPDTHVYLISKDLQPVTSDANLSLLPNVTFETCPRLDVICVPGGPGQIDLMEDEDTLGFLRHVAEHARLVTSVCTGSLVLGAAGLLRGYQATCHWTSLDQLSQLGAEPRQERVVWDRNRVTGAGVTSGIDFALTVVAGLHGDEVAEMIQLSLEYDPKPPFTAGSLATASPELSAAVRQRSAEMLERRRSATRKAAVNLGLA